VHKAASGLDVFVSCKCLPVLPYWLFSSQKPQIWLFLKAFGLRIFFWLFGFFWLDAVTVEAMLQRFSSNS